MTLNLQNFFKTKGKMSKMGDFQALAQIKGLQISAVSADLYSNGRDDVCLFYFQDGKISREKNKFANAWKSSMSL